MTLWMPRTWGCINVSVCCHGDSSVNIQAKDMPLSVFICIANYHMVSDGFIVKTNSAFDKKV